MQTILEMIEHSHCEVKKPVGSAIASVLDPNGCVLYPSDTHNSLLGYDPNEIIGRCVFSLVHPDDVSATQEHFTILKTTLIHQGAEFRLKHKRGYWIDVIAEGAPVYLDGELRGFLVIARPRITIDMSRFTMYVKRRYGCIPR